MVEYFFDFFLIGSLVAVIVVGIYELRRVNREEKKKMVREREKVEGE